MAYLVAMGAVLQCSFGAAPTTLIVIPKGVPVNAPYTFAATVMDYAPIVNIPTFGMCSSIANPVVASATAAALGVLTPMPCIPATVAPWTPGAIKTKIGTFPALTDSSMCNCMWGGVIKINSPGQFVTQVT